MHFWNSWPGLYMRHLASPQKMFFTSVAIVFCCILSTSSPSFLIACQLSMLSSTNHSIPK